MSLPSCPLINGGKVDHLLIQIWDLKDIQLISFSEQWQEIHRDRPPCGNYKCNISINIYMTNGAPSFSTYLIFRNDEGSLICAFASSLVVSSHEVALILATMISLLLVVQDQIKGLIIECDMPRISRWTQDNQASCPWKWWEQMTEIKRCMSHLDCKWSFIFKEFNITAFFLAKYDASMNSPYGAISILLGQSGLPNYVAFPVKDVETFLILSLIYWVYESAHILFSSIFKAIV